MIFQLIYTSSAKDTLDDFALREIAQISSYNNQKIGVTGLLLFHKGAILQVLEGDEESVETVYAKVKRDERHSGCMTLSTRTSERREFSDWFMGYKNVSSRQGADSLFKLSTTSLTDMLPSDPSIELSTLTRTYARVSGL